MECEHDIIDADGHVVDQDKDLRRYLPAPWNEKDWTREYYLFPSPTAGCGACRRATRPRCRTRPTG